MLYKYWKIIYKFYTTLWETRQGEFVGYKYFYAIMKQIM